MLDTLNLTKQERGGILDFIDDVCERFDYPNGGYLIHTTHPDTWLSIDLKNHTNVHGGHPIEPGQIIEDKQHRIPERFNAIITSDNWCIDENTIRKDDWHPEYNMVSLPYDKKNPIATVPVEWLDASRIRYFRPNDNPELAQWPGTGMSISGEDMERIKHGDDLDATITRIYEHANRFFWDGDTPQEIARKILADTAWQIDYRLPDNTTGLFVETIRPSWVQSRAEQPRFHKK